MISLKRWVRHNLDMLQKLVLLIMDWVNRTPEIACDYDIATFKSKLYRWIYKSYVLQQREDFNPYDPELYEYFSMKFSEDIIDVFLHEVLFDSLFKVIYCLFEPISYINVWFPVNILICS